MSSNYLYGTFPASVFDMKKMSVFDISRNSITGTFDFSLFPLEPYGQNQLRAFVNRLSGPLNILSMGRFQEPNVLLGGVYSCNTLPTNDKYYQFYGCGSDKFKVACYVWLSMTVVFFIIFIRVTDSMRILRGNSESLLKLIQKRLSRNVISLPAESAEELQLNEMYTERPSNLVEAVSTGSQKRPSALTESWRYSFARQFVRTLDLLQKFVLLSTTIIIISSTIAYAVFKVAIGGDLYNTHAYQYLYQVSGVFLKNWQPAFVLTIFLTFIIMLSSYVYYILMVQEWVNLKGYRSLCYENAHREAAVAEYLKSEHYSVVVTMNRLLIRIQRLFKYLSRDSYEKKMKEEAVKKRDFKISRVLRRWYTYFIRLFGIMLFMGVCGFCDAQIVLANRIEVLEVPRNYLYLFQSAFIIIKLFLRLTVIKLLVNYLFEKDWQKRSFIDRKDRILWSLNTEKMDGVHHTSTSTKVLGILFNFASSFSPLIASLFASDVCFRNIISPASPESISYGYETCSQYSTFLGNCLTYSTITQNLSVLPPFVFSNQCRNAILETYIPYFIQSAMFDSIFSLSKYLMLSQVHKLEWYMQVAPAWLPLDWCHFTARDFLIPDITVSVIDILSQFALLFTYGYISGVTALAIGFYKSPLKT